jgi:murein DD-endopeptidase MepM/ murein hydrolase activator NlpD
VHLGVDLFAPAGTPVDAPLPAVVHSVAVNTSPLDYGPTILLRHELAHPDAPGGPPLEFFSLYGHLSLASLVAQSGVPRLRPGDAVAAGGVVGWVGPRTANGGWPPHLHFQLCTEADLGGWRGDYPGVCAPEDWAAYALLCPDPNLLLRCESV